MVIQRVITDLVQGAPHMGDITENDPKRERSQLLGVLGFRRCDPINILSPQASYFPRGMLSRNHSYVPFKKTSDMLVLYNTRTADVETRFRYRTVNKVL